jgi:hydrogenase nickel incorporation protein HypB
MDLPVDKLLGDQEKEVWMSQRVLIVEQILNANDQLAAENSARLDASGVFAINILASPGAGKTSLILRTIEALSERLRLGVVEGDTAPVTIDADKVSARGIPVVQINTGGDCHLDAVMLQMALPQFDLAQLDLMIVENVGNLICPANFRLGTHKNILIASVPEGDDKPYKYPGIYRGVDALIINKIDLLPYVPFNMDYFQRGVEMLNPGLVTFPLSCRTGEGLEAWVEWLAAATRAKSISSVARKD